MVLSLATITSCSSSAEKVNESKNNVEQAQQNLEKAKADYENQYNTFKAESDAKITANEKLIIDLKKYTKKVLKCFPTKNPFDVLKRVYNYFGLLHKNIIA